MSLASILIIAPQAFVLTSPDQIRLKAPVKTWDEGIPLGNGFIGALLWGEGRQLNVSLDCGRLWDERLPEVIERPDWTYAQLREWKRQNNYSKIHEYFDIPYDTVPYPTKLPAGRLELKLPEGWTSDEFSLDMKKGAAEVRFNRGSISALTPANKKVFLIDLPEGSSVELKRPESLNLLNYSRPQAGREGKIHWFTQQGAKGFSWTIAYSVEEAETSQILAATIVDSQESKDTVAEAKKRLSFSADWKPIVKDHTDWWSKWWERSSVAVPDERIQWQYNLAKYYYGAASRRGGKPIPLQGLWTADAGTLPPWKGDYHNDLNTQTTYLAYHTAGLNEAGECWLDYNWKLLPAYRSFASKFYGQEGAAVPGVMTLAGQPRGGWAQYSLSPTMGAWVAQSFHRHWRFTADRRFLKDRAYPFCAEIAECLRGLLERGSDGKWRLPLSTSPEIHDNSPESWLEPNSNFDNALLMLLFRACAEMADELGKPGEARKWRAISEELPDLLVDESGALMFANGEPMQESHRHHSHLMAIHPLELLSIESAADRRTIRTSLNATLAHGTQAWVGYSFAWMSCMLSRAGEEERALTMLEDYARAFVLRNGFHANGDQIGAGLSGFTYRPVTLEGNFLAMEAVHDMLLQSWGGRVRLFPAVSEKWPDASFDQLRAEGGFVVSAERKAGETVSGTMRATVDGELCLDARGLEQVEWKGGKPALSRGLWVLEMKRGQTLSFVRVQGNSDAKPRD